MFYRVPCACLSHFQAGASVVNIRPVTSLVLLICHVTMRVCDTRTSVKRNEKMWQTFRAVTVPKRIKLFIQ
jgi:hypothetical protein